MYRVIALGHEAGEIVDQLRSNGIYDDIRFLFCDTESNRLKTHGRDDDKRVQWRLCMNCGVTPTIHIVLLLHHMPML